MLFIFFISSNSFIGFVFEPVHKILFTAPLHLGSFLPNISFKVFWVLWYVFQMDLSNLDLETLAPYIPMDGEDFQLNPIISESESLERNPVGSVGTNNSSNSSSPKTHQQSFCNITSLFQPLPSSSQTNVRYQPGHSASWATGEKSNHSTANNHVSSYTMGPIQNPPYQAPASTPLSSMGGRQNLQWPPDPLLTYPQQLPTSRAYLIDTLSGEMRTSSEQDLTKNKLPRWRSVKWIHISKTNLKW